MTTLICTGSLFSGWRRVLEKQVMTSSLVNPAFDIITTLSRDICQQQFQETDELSWRPFSADHTYINKAAELLSSVESETLFTWGDSNSCLYLNFWKNITENTKFLLIYSSPEFELSNYINTHTFDSTRIDLVIESWIIRTRAMLTFLMKNRHRCLLVDVQSADLERELFIKAIERQFNLDIDLGSGSSGEPLRNTNSILIEYLATTLVRKNKLVSELYDEVRSAATLLTDKDDSILSIEERSNSLINEFISEVSAYKKLGIMHSKLKDEFSLKELQINQLIEELEYHFNKNVEQEQVTNTMAEYLANDSLLKIARQVRQLP